MKISETTSYPHPVLAPWSTDITGAAIDTKITFREQGDGRQISIHCETHLDQGEIVSLIQDGSATFGCFVKCQETGLRRLQPLGFPIGIHDFGPGALLGRVQFRPMVWTNKRIDSYSPTGAHAEFGGAFDIEAGQILALDDEKIIDVTRPPIAAIESIFEIRSSDQVPEGKFEVDAESDRISIRMSETTYQLVQNLRGNNDVSRDVLMNSLYVPIVMQVLDSLSEGDEQFEHRRWFHPFRARCELEGVDIAKPDLFNDAQRFLSKPFAALAQLIEKVEE